MPVLISMLRGVNLGGHNKIKMDALRALYESLKFEDPHSYIQSGNVIFRSKEKNTVALAKKIQDAIECTFGFRPEVILRTPGELRKAIAATPFPAHRNLHPSKILITFLAGDPGPEAQSALLAPLGLSRGAASKRPRTLHLFSQRRRQRSRLPWSKLDKLLQTAPALRHPLEQRHENAGHRRRDGIRRVKSPCVHDAQPDERADEGPLWRKKLILLPCDYQRAVVPVAPRIRSKHKRGLRDSAPR